MSSKTKIERRLWLAAEHRAAQASLEIAEDCAYHLQAFIGQGAETLKKKNLIDDPDQVALAETNIVAFVTRMIIESRRQRLDSLHEPTFFKAREVLCPIFPFC